MKKRLLTLALGLGLVGSGYAFTNLADWTVSIRTGVSTLLDKVSSPDKPSPSALPKPSAQGQKLAPIGGKPLPVPVTALTATTVCQGQTVTLSAPSGYSQYLWSNGETTQTINPTVSGHYTVRVAGPNGVFSDTLGGAYNSGVTIFPIGATSEDSIWMFVDPTGTCPLAVNNANQSLVGATQMRAHAGVRTNNNNFQNVVAANDGNPNSPSLFSLDATRGWVKGYKPRTYHNVAGGTTIQALTFVLTGNAQNGGWFPKEGKNVSGCSDFIINLPIVGAARKSPFGVTVTFSAPAAAPTISANRTIQNDSIVMCQGQSVTLTAAGGAGGYNWSTAEVGSSITVNTSGVYSVNSNVGACTSATSTPVTVVVTNSGIAVPTITAGSALTFCPGSSVVLDAGVAPAGHKYRWSNGDTTRTTTVRRSGSYTASFLDGECLSNPSNALVVNVLAKPLPVQVTASGPTSFCTGGSVELSAPAGYSHYLWSNGATTRTITATVAGHYTVRVANANGCYSDTLAGTYTSGLTVYPVGATGDDSVYMFLNPALTCPLPTSNAFQSLFGATSVRAHLGVRINNNNFSNVVAANDGNPNSPSLFQANGPGAWVKRFVPRTYNGVNPSTAIQALTFVLTGNPQNGGWFDKEGKVQPGCGDFVINFPIVASPVRSPFGVTVSINSTPAVPTATPAGPTTFCQGQGVRLVASGGTSGNYIWSNGDVSDTLRATVAGNYSVRSFAGACTSAASAPVTVTITSSAAPIIQAAGPTTFCSGGSVVLTTPAIVGATYEWSNGATTRSITVKTSGSYTVRVYRNGCGSALSTPTAVNILARPLPVQVVASGPTAICPGDSVTLSAPTGYASYRWNNGATTRTIKVKSAGNFTVRVANANGCMSDTLGGTTTSGLTAYPIGATADDSVFLFLNPSKTCPLPANNAFQSLLGASEVRAHLGVRIGGSGFQYVVGANDGNTNSRSKFNALNDGWVKGFITRSYNGVPANTAIEALTFVLTGGPQSGGWFNKEGKEAPFCSDFVIPFPIVASAGPSPFGVQVTMKARAVAPAIVGSTTFCTGTSATISTSQPLGANEVYVWSNGAATASINVTAAGSYSLRILNTASGCFSPRSATINVTETPLPATQTVVASGPTTFNVGGFVDLTATGGGTSWLWSNGLTTQRIRVRTAGNYSVVAISNGCTSATSTPVTVTVNRTSSDLVVNAIESNGGTFYNVTVAAAGFLTLSAPLVVEGTMTVNGTLHTSGFSISGPGDFILADGATLVVTSPAGINASGNTGDITVVGNRTISAGANIYYGGTGAQVTGTALPAKIKSISIGNSGGVTLTSPTSVTEKLALEVGNFNLNNRVFTLISDANGTAYLDQSAGNGSVSNASNFTVERWINRARTTSDGGWFFVGAPVQGFAASGWSAFNVFSASTYNTSVAGGSSLFLYDATAPASANNNGYVKVPSASTVIAPGVGARLWIRNGNFFTAGQGDSRLRAKGAPVLGTYNFPNLRYCASGCTFANENGFNLVANPYASAIDWDDASWTKTNLEDAVYIYDFLNGRYSTYINGVGVNGGSNMIPSSQGFFVWANAASPALSIQKEAARTTNPSMRRAGAVTNVLHLTLSNAANQSDQTAVRFSPSATAGYDANLDGRNLAGDILDISTIGANGESLSVDSRPVVGTSIIPLALKLTGSGMITFNGLSSFDNGVSLSLLDQTTGQTTPVAEGLQVAVNGGNRYALVVNNVTSLNNNLATSFSIYPNPTRDQLTLNFADAASHKLTLRNTLGQVVYSSTEEGNTAVINISHLAAGVYYLDIPGYGKQKVVKE